MAIHITEYIETIKRQFEKSTKNENIKYPVVKRNIERNIRQE